MIEAGLLHYEARKAIEAKIREDDENRKYKRKGELSREYGLSGHC